MRTYDWKTVVLTAREKSPFYRQLYKQIPEANYSLNDLPTIKQEEFWQANELTHNKLLTGPFADGVVFKSGGTTGKPKYAFYTREEWAEEMNMFAQKFGDNGFSQGDRVANLFYVGELYSSFIFINDALTRCSIDMIHLPIAGSTSPAEIVATLQKFAANVICGLPTTIISLAKYVVANKLTDFKVEKIFYGGEPLLIKQENLLKRVFPGVRVASIGYASVDAGAIGYCDKSCTGSEHRGFDRENILEIVDIATGEPIMETGVVGRVIVTRLTRLLMPIIRYPVGDLGVWVEPPGTANRKFRLCGRADEGIRVGSVTLYTADVAAILEQYTARLGITNFQMVITRECELDKLTIVLACQKSLTAADIALIRDSVYSERKNLKESVLKGLVSPLTIKGTDASGMEINKRTGKMPKVLDKRVG